MEVTWQEQLLVAQQPSNSETLAADVMERSGQV